MDREKSASLDQDPQTILSLLARRCSEQENLIADLWNNALDLKQHRHELAYERDLLRTLADNMPDYIYVKDRDHHFIMNNRAHLRVLGVTDQASAAGKTDFDFFPCEMARQYAADEKLIVTRGTPIIDREEKSVDQRGNETWVSTTKVPLRNDDGKIVGIVGISRDISHRKRAEAEQTRLEAELRQSQKLEVLGQLAGGIVHDFNNMLCVINGYSAMLKQRLDETDPEAAEFADAIAKAGESAAGITRKLLSFVKKDTMQHSVVEMHDLVEGAVALLRHIIDPRITIATDLRAEQSCVLGDRSHLESALLNIAVNARDAMPEGGHLLFASRIENLAKPPAGCVAGPYLLLSITDTGTGMDEKTKSMIFEPFFTTKGKGKGTGLGLSSVYVTIKNHGGFIAVNSKVGAGTTVTLQLPLAVDQPQADTTAAPSAQTATKRILIVEDEDMIRTMVADMLSEQGYGISVCSGGREAVDYMHDHPGEVDVAIVDIVMPDMTGSECISTLRRMDPHIKFIVATGAGGTDTQTLLRGDRIVGLVRKPFDEEDLLRVIGAV